jgi:phosphatidylinositol alpha-mannosyltransferase
LQLAGHLKERGHEVLVLGPGVRPSAHSGVRIVGRPLRVPYRGTVAPICLSLSSVGRVRSALREFRPDVVHAHEPFAPSSSMAATLAARSPVAATFHAFSERSGLFDVTAPLLRPVWRRLAARVAVSEAAAAFVRSRMGDGIRVVPNGLDVDLFAVAEPATGLPPGRRVLWVGRLDRQKGFPVALRAFERLAREFDDLTLVVAGDGRDRDALRSISADVRDRVVMLGTVPHGRLPGYHATADVFVSPATGQESFGLVLVEAMAAGVPVVASDIAGYREVVRHGRDGLLVPPADPAALAEAVERILSDPGLANRLREGGRSRAGEFSWETVADRLEDVYREALEIGPRR